MYMKIWTFILISALCLQSLLVGTAPYQLISDQNQLSILTASLAERQTEKMILSNGMEVYLISDPGSAQGGAVLKVQAGSWDDPKEHQGLAHFVEHMLFLGTEKYPIESDYDRFIHSHDGEMNAFTTTDYTLFAFSVASPALNEALDRFSSFFKKPLFSPSGVERERHSVDQEFEKNLLQNGSRELQVRKELANPNHPFHLFGTGNLTSLANVTQKDLKEWYETHYSSQGMRLIVYGPQSLDQLRKWILEDFIDVPSHKTASNKIDEKILREEMQGKMVYIEPTANTRTLRMTWEIPPALVSLDSFKPSDFISRILGDDGAGSLISILRKEGLAYDISLSKDRLSEDNLLFSLNINLSQAGMDNLPQVIQRCFQVMQRLAKENFPPYLFDELNKIQTIRYQYPSRENTFSYLMSLGESFAYEKLPAFPENALISQNFNAEAVKNFLNLLKPSTAHYTLIAHQNMEFYDHHEKWMQVPYKVTAIPKEQIEAWSLAEPMPDFHFPPPNPFIPDNLEIVNTLNPEGEKPAVLHPELIANDSQAQIYFAEDRQFLTPQTKWFFEIKTPSISKTDPNKVVLSDLYLRYLEFSIRNLADLAGAADLSYKIFKTNTGIALSLYGYRDNTAALYDAILDKLKGAIPSEKEFEQAKASLFGKYSASFNQGNPLQQGFDIYQKVLFESSPLTDTRKEILSHTSYRSFLSYLDHFYDSTFTEGLLYGNIQKEDALLIWNKLKNKMNSSSGYPRQAIPKERIINPGAPYAIEMDIPTPSHAAILAIGEGEFSFKKRAAEEILSKALSSAFYSTLRTKQQTGYLINLNTEEIDNHLFTFFAVQSATYDPRDLLARFELFIENFLQEMKEKDLNPQNFENIKRALAEDLIHSPKNLTEMADLLKKMAFQHGGDFDYCKKRIEGFQDLSYDEFIDITKEYLGKENKRRIAVLLKGKSDKDFHYQTISDPKEMRSLALYSP